MANIVVVTTSYPERRGDAQGHFVGAEVRRLLEEGDVTVLAPGPGREPLWGERVVGLDGAAAFGFPGALEKLRRRPLSALSASRFVWSATRWLSRAPEPRRVIAHFLLPCGVPIATRALRGRSTQLEVVVHGSDARLFAALPAGQQLVARELVAARADLRFTSNELYQLVLRALPGAARRALSPRARVAQSPMDVDGTPSKAEARRALGIDATAKVAVIVARLISGKRVDVALEACRRVPGLLAFVLGDGPERARLERRFPHARFAGHVPHQLALAHIAAADALVSASLHEGAPTAVREARALGTPVVCLEAGDLMQWAAADPGLQVVPARPALRA